MALERVWPKDVEAVFLPVGFRVVRIPVPYHDNLLELFGRLATLSYHRQSSDGGTHWTEPPGGGQLRSCGAA